MKGKNLLILGAGQYGRVVRDTAVAMGGFHQIDFLDDAGSFAVGRLAEYETFRQTCDCAFVAMGNPEIRKLWLEKLEQAGYELPVLIHPMAWVSPTAVLEKGTIVEPMAVVHSEAVVESGGLICAGCVVNHNARIHSCCQVDCGAVVESGAVVPEKTKVPSCTVWHRE